jgi:hypothetical protein
VTLNNRDTFADRLENAAKARQALLERARAKDKSNGDQPDALAARRVEASESGDGRRLARAEEAADEDESQSLHDVVSYADWYQPGEKVGQAFGPDVFCRSGFPA